MKTYPKVIDLSKYTEISDDTIATDIRDTEQEIAALDLTRKAEEEQLAGTLLTGAQRRMVEFKADSRPVQIEERRAFVAFLRRIQAARRSFRGER